MVNRFKAETKRDEQLPEQTGLEPPEMVNPVPRPTIATPARSGGGHVATYAADKRKGGWLVRVAGPRPDMFSGRIIPVTRRDRSIGDESLERVVWTGKDEDTGENVALYKFAPKPQSLDEIPF